MGFRGDLQDWVVDAVKAHDGRASVLAVAKHVWENHSEDIKGSGDHFYTWQYDMRWAAQKLRNDGVLRIREQRSWELVG